MNSLLPASNSSTVSTVAADSGEHPLVDEVLRQGKERKKERKSGACAAVWWW